jgi:hypothetical protein
MTRPPLIVLLSLLMIALVGTFFAVTATSGGAPGAGALYLLLPLTAYACLRAVKFSRTALFVAAIGAVAPLAVGIMLSWPDFAVSLPYLIGAFAIFFGLCGMLAPSARAWYAGARAHQLLD